MMMQSIRGLLQLALRSICNARHDFRNGYGSLNANGVDENERFSHNSQTQVPSEETWDSAFGQTARIYGATAAAVM